LFVDIAKKVEGATLNFSPGVGVKFPGELRGYGDMIGRVGFGTWDFCGETHTVLA
jgi:hypothetical protein